MDIISFLKETWYSIYENSFVNVQMLIASMYIYMSSKKGDKKYHGIALIPIIITIIIMFNPFLAQIMVKYGTIYEYKRIYWVLPANGVIACAVTMLLIRHKEWWKRMAIFVTLVLYSTCTLTFNGVWNLKNFVKADNTLHVQQETVEVADIIMNDGRMSKMAAMPDELCLDIRSYEPSIKLLNSYKGYEYYYGDEYEKDQDLMYYQINRADAPDVKKTGEWLRMYDFVYVVWDKGKVNKSDMEAVLFELIAETEHYEIYAVRKELLI